jgi:hypothetical protein
MCISKYISSISLLCRFLPSWEILNCRVDLSSYNPAINTLHHWIRHNIFAVSNIWHYIQTTLCKNKKIVVLPLMCFFMTTELKNDSVTPYVFSITIVLPLMFFSWRPIKNNSVTPYVLFDDNWEKTTLLPLTFPSKWQCYPICFFSWRPIKNDSATPFFLFHDDQ